MAIRFNNDRDDSITVDVTLDGRLVQRNHPSPPVEDFEESFTARFERLK